MVLVLIGLRSVLILNMIMFSLMQVLLTVLVHRHVKQFRARRELKNARARNTSA